VHYSKANLLSVRPLVKEGGHFMGTYNNLKVYNESGTLVRGSGFYTVTYQDLLDAESKRNVKKEDGNSIYKIHHYYITTLSISN
jgi:hypothetical protein